VPRCGCLKKVEIRLLLDVVAGQSGRKERLEEMR
jgi:hypothetical protein